jgi:hypothetical protein
VTILFDECVPRPLRRALKPHRCITVQEMGWSGASDGKLLLLAPEILRQVNLVRPGQVVQIHAAPA